MADYKATAAELASIANAIRLKGGTSAALEYPSEWITAIENLTPASGGQSITPQDPTAQYKVTDTELTAIANAIRTRCGISTQLEFPTEYVAAINAIPTQEYENLEYIQSDATQMIYLGLTPTLNEELSVKLAVISPQTSRYTWVLFSSTPSEANIVGFQFDNYYRRLQRFNGNSFQYEQIAYDTVYQRSVTVANANNEQMEYTAFGIYLNGQIGYNIVIKLYELSIGTHTFKPKRRTSDGVCGLYDITADTFLTDAAGGNPFIAGPVIP